MDNQTAPSSQPKNTSFVPLASEIPQYRQDKLAGQRRMGPITNIAPIWSNIHHAGPSTISPQATIIQPKSVTLELTDSPVNEEIGRLRKLLDEKEQQLDTVNNENTSQQGQYGQIERQMQATEALVKNLKQQLTNMNDTNTSQADSQVLQEQITDKERESRTMQAEISELKQQVNSTDQLKEEITQYKTHIRELSQEQERLHNLFLQETQKVQSLTQQIESQQTASAREPQSKYQGMLEEIIQTPPQAQPVAQPAQRRVVQPRIIQTDDSFPPLTEEINAVNGIVKNSSGKLVDQAIVIIKDKANHNLRALKSNQLGQFVAATPLPDGEYFIEVEKDQLVFDLISIYLTGEKIPPIEIVSHELTA